MLENRPNQRSAIHDDLGRVGIACARPVQRCAEAGLDRSSLPFFLRQLCRRALLYTAMVTTGALLHGKGNYLAYNNAEHILWYCNWTELNRMR